MGSISAVASRGGDGVRGQTTRQITTQGSIATIMIRKALRQIWADIVGQVGKVGKGGKGRQGKRWVENDSMLSKVGIRSTAPKLKVRRERRGRNSNEI